MTNLQFSINSTIEPKKLMSFITDFEYYQKFFPSQIKEVKILERQNNEIITEETIRFSTLIKSPFVQKSRHKIISDKELFTEILEGPAKGSVVKIICDKNSYITRSLKWFTTISLNFIQVQTHYNSFQIFLC